jgi:hypothetical protein
MEVFDGLQAPADRNPMHHHRFERWAPALAPPQALAVARRNGLDEDL